MPTDVGRQGKQPELREIVSTREAASVSNASDIIRTQAEEKKKKAREKNAAYKRKKREEDPEWYEKEKRGSAESKRKKREEDPQWYEKEKNASAEWERKKREEDPQWCKNKNKKNAEWKRKKREKEQKLTQELQEADAGMADEHLSLNISLPLRQLRAQAEAHTQAVEGVLYPPNQRAIESGQWSDPKAWPYTGDWRSLPDEKRLLQQAWVEGVATKYPDQYLHHLAEVHAQPATSSDEERVRRPRRK